MTSHELNKRVATAYPATPDLASSTPAGPTPSGPPAGVLPFAPIRSAAEYDSEGEEGQAKARRIEDYDAPIQPLLDENLTAWEKVRAFGRLNEGQFLQVDGRPGVPGCTRSETADGL